MESDVSRILNICMAQPITALGLSVYAVIGWLSENV
jgi:hypothetical protein